MRIGQLQNRVTIERKSSEPDGAGGVVESWSVIATRWAMVQAKRGEERAESDRVQAVGSYQVVFRNPIDIRETDRLIWRGEAYNVRFVPRVGREDQYITVDADLGYET